MTRDDTMGYNNNNNNNNNNKLCSACKTAVVFN